MKLYTKTVCPKCMFVKNQLDQKDVEYEVINIDTDTDASEVLRESNIMAVPVLEFDGKLLSKMEDINEAISKINK